MTITAPQLHQCIHHAGFPIQKRLEVVNIINKGLTGYREHRSRWYYSAASEKKIKKPSYGHQAPQGRHNQTDARHILVSALCRAWIYGLNSPPTLNHKNGLDTDFAKFAMEIMQLEGIGRAHQHLEEYWSFRKSNWELNDFT